VVKCDHKFVDSIRCLKCGWVPLPDPILVEHEGIVVVRDDLLPGGTKRRALHVLLDDQHNDYVYASPVYGFAQIALAHTAQDYNRNATIFCAKRNYRHERTRMAEALGAQIIEVPHGYLNVVKARAQEYCQRTGAKLLPFGLDDEEFILALADVARRLPIAPPTEVWSVCGSGVLSRALQLAWPDANFFGVRVGIEPDAGRARVFRAPEEFEQLANLRPPFPSTDNYDAKAWSFVKRYASPGALFWNVAA